MKIIAVSGYKDSGKTTLCRVLIQKLSDRGLSVGYIKRSHENVISSSDTDSGSVATIGTPSLLWGDDGFSMEIKSPDNRQTDPYEVVGKFFPTSDIVILEGGKDLVLPKIWVSCPDEETPDLPGIFAVYDRRRAGDGGRRYGIDDLDRLVSVITDKAELSFRSARVYIGARELPMKDFVADFISGGVTGMIGALKKPDGADEEGDVRVYIRKH